MSLFHIQNSDRNIGPSHFDQFGLDKLLITKIFYTIQGEGPYAGHPAVFVRLAGCNRGAKLTMGCQFCDTSFQVDAGMAMTFEQIGSVMDEVSSVLTSCRTRGDGGNPLVVITGGEPMMQDNLVSFIEYLGRNCWPEIQIESNGDRLAHDFLASKWCETVSLVVSPKMTRDKYLDLKSSIFHRANALKFVVDARSVSPYHNIPAYAALKDPDQVYVSPLTVYKRSVEIGEIPSAWNTELVDQQLTRDNYEYAAQLAMKFGFRTSMQQHLFFVQE